MTKKPKDFCMQTMNGRRHAALVRPPLANQVQHNIPHVPGPQVAVSGDLVDLLLQAAQKNAFQAL